MNENNEKFKKNFCLENYLIENRNLFFIQSFNT